MLMGAGYKGSSDLMNSGNGNLEIIPVNPDSNKRYNFYKFSFKSRTVPVRFKINNDETIFLDEPIFSIDRLDSPIHSFIVLDANVDFSWIGAYNHR